MFRIFLILSGFLGSTGVALDAYAAHGLAKILSEDKVAVFKIASQYQITHAIALLIIALLVRLYPSRLFNLAGILITTGLILFSGSLYLLTYSGIKVGLVTPIGGFALIAGWLCIGLTACKIPAKSASKI